MTSKIKYHKNYTELGQTYQLVLPLSLEGLVPDDDSVRLLSHELEELDYTLLYQAYSAKGRNPAVDPKTMFKILTYAYSQNIYSSRKIETACRRDINFMWLLAGQKAPDHSTIARFRTGFLLEVCEDLFYQMVRRLAAMGELSKETVFIDGTKLEVCANKYTFVWKKSVGKWEEKMFSRIETAVLLINQEYIQSFTITKENRTADLQKIVDFLDNYCREKYEKWKKRSFKKDISKRENMSYEENSDTYTCHAGKLLKPIFTKNQKSKSGYKSEVTVYECEDCGGCPQKEKCTKAKGNKRLYISKNFITRRQESYENILSETGVKYRMNRSIQVEGAFGVLKGDYEFQRFLLRGKIKVKLEFLLLCLGYNINKLHAKIQNERTGSHLFQVRSA